MTLNELIDALQDVADTNGGDTVMLATQPHWPLAMHLRGVYVPDSECPAHGLLECEECEEAEGWLPGGQVWLVEGDQADNPYAVPAGAWEAR